MQINLPDVYEGTIILSESNYIYMYTSVGGVLYNIHTLVGEARSRVTR